MQIYRSFYLLFIKFPFHFPAYKITTFPPALQLFAQKSYQCALLEPNRKLIFHYITLKICTLHPKSKLSTLERA